MTELSYIAIDFETANYYRNSACQVGLVRFINGEETDSVSSLIKPAKMYFVPEFTQDIHGISYDDVRNKPQFPEVWDSIVMPFINKTGPLPFVAHNAGFDMAVMRECCSYFGMDVPDFQYFDSLALAKSVWPEMAAHRLTALGEHFGINYLAHDALEDSRTCGLIVKKAAEKKECNCLDGLLKTAGIQMYGLRS